MASYYEFSYILTEDEIVKGLKASGSYKSMGKRGIIETVILAAFTVFFLVSYFRTGQVLDVVMSGVCILVLTMLNLIPRLDMRKQSRKGQKDVMLRIYPGKIFIYTKDDTITIDIAKSKICYCKKDEVYAIMMEQGGILVVPERVLPAEGRSDIKAYFKQADS